MALERGGYPVTPNAAWEMINGQRVDYHALGYRATRGGVVGNITTFSLVHTRQQRVEGLTFDRLDYFGGQVDLHTVNYLDTDYCQRGSSLCETLISLTPGIPLLIVTCEPPDKLFDLAEYPTNLIIPKMVISTAPYKEGLGSNFGQETGTYLFNPDDSSTDGMLARGHLRMSKPEPHGPGSSRRWEAVQILTRQDRLQPRALTRAARALKEAQ